MKETKQLEFKETITNTFLKTVSAYANYEGGDIVFGVNDNGIIIGLDEITQKCLDIENKINDSITPQPNYELKITSDKTIILHVDAGSETPYLYKSKAYKRNDTATIEVDRLELTRLILKGSHRDYEQLPSSTQKLTFKKLEEELIREVEISKLDTNVLKTLNLFSNEEGYNIAAEILADNNKLPGIDIAKIGNSISVIQRRETYEHTSVLNLYEYANQFFQIYYQYEQIEGNTRKRKYLIPNEAYREAVANALIHRLWDVNEHIRILMFEDKIEIISPGGLPEGMTKDTYLAGIYSKLRNPILANVFYRLKLVEIFGTGIRRIKEVYQDSITKPNFEIFENAIKVILPVVKEKSNLNPDMYIVYNALENIDGNSMGEISSKVSFGKTKIRKILVELENENMIEIIGSGKSRKYKRK